MKKSERIDIRVPLPLLAEIEEYQRAEKIPTRTGALLELARIGLKQKGGEKP
ncbi:hypothetical protein ACTHPH_24040 [Paenibacillus pasadenensis]|uniref:hypothetical protein n=1 Tax=Paenibacillus pasadenensis TaxID=217090 RepID=UPI0004125511|nr:hypothetical protein [Paenibacillus pasadenensis]